MQRSARGASEAHRAEVEAWRARRYAALRRPVGWLTLAGLHWLAPGDNRIGSDRANQIVLPGGPARAGLLRLTGGRVTAHAEPGARLEHGGDEAQDLELVADTDAPQDQGPTMLSLGALRMCLIRRRDRLALRVWDTASPARAEFDGIPHFPVDPAWRLDAEFHRSAPSRTVSVPDVLGAADELASPGSVAFSYAGVVHRLEALEGGRDGALWLIFADATSGAETYGGGRYLYTDPPRPDGSVVVDFNRAYNPPCVFGPYATCSLPWSANRLPIRIEAGEMAYGYTEPR